MTLLYAGIGSRETPTPVLKAMTHVARSLAALGYTLRSGGADGADRAFEAGASLKEIFLARHATPAAIETVARFHPAPHRLSVFAEKLRARNAMILLGANLDSPVRFVVCWTPRGEITGGTGQGLRIARHYKIPVVNMFFADWESRIASLVHPST